MAAEPVLVIVTVAVKPLPQSFRVYPTEHAAVPAEVDGLADADAEGLADLDADGLIDRGGLPPLLFTMNAECVLNTDNSGAPCFTL
jgi:hypothetical protein